ncbi:CBS domain-containing protein [Weissella uvarum]|uniref:cyclic di-AMP binding protein CbpA n=1 Tax=Weissella uvarum TaxID=1479233 RepID=UPI0019617D9F|nr:cyclic di-AMP binding protein CbpA [Weissella uvarum]MBM7618059.1 CBS domain-containing protein [Weissella uvarum]MCM0595084.1 CBS domain-containing protein [Weissella uvarum]
MLEKLVKPKERLTTVTESTTLSEALTILEDYNFRAIPIVDSTGQLYRGVVYKMHLYRHLAKDGDMQLPVTAVMRNMTKFINLDDSFFDLTFAIRDLPFISVLDQQNHFIGIITHTRYMKLLEDSWEPEEGNYVITLVADGERGSLDRAAKIMSRYTTLLSIVTVNPTEQLRTGRIIATLPGNLSDKTRQRMVKALERKGFVVENTETLYR